MSGRSKPPSVQCGIQLSAEPGQIPGYLMPCFDLHPQGFAVSSVMSFFAQQVCIIARDIPYRFCSIAVILTTPEIRAAYPVGGGTFLSYVKNVTVGRTLPLILILIF